MTNGKIERLRYFKGQLLTAQDFQSEQQYHRDRVTRLLRRFPYGIIDGLNVVRKTRTDDDPNSFDGFLIEEGLAVDREGNQIVAGSEGIRVLLTDVPPAGDNTPYLSLSYLEEPACAGDFCNPSSQKNRMHEFAEISWESIPNGDSYITVAYINRVMKDEDQIEFDLRTDQSPEGKRIRINANIFGEENIADGAISDDKIKPGAVTQSKILDGAITSAKIRNWDGTISGPATENGIRTAHIRPLAVNDDKIASGAVLSRHVREYDPGNPNENHGIKAGHIQNDAIESRHIRSYNPANPNVNHGIKTSHIQNDAIESRHIKEYDPTDPNSNDHGIKTGHIQNGAITASKIRYANGSIDSTNDNGVKTDHIRDGAVTTPKLSVLDLDGTLDGTFGTPGLPPGDPDPIMEDNPVVIFDGANYEEVRFPHVLPITPETRLAWSFEIERMPEDRMAYHFHISKNTPGVVTYKIQFVRFTGSD